jgi:opacity protein-like surface antigen
MLSARTLVGIEGDVGWSSLENKIALTTPDVFTIKLAQKLSYAARVRLGFLATPETLLYGTAGWVRSKFEYSIDYPFIVDDIADKHWVDGVQAGVGIETNLGNGWGGRLEYIHTFYQKRDFFGGLDVRPAVGIGRIALIRRFNSDKSGASWDSPEPTTRWSGVYIGGAIGAGTGSTKVDLLELPGSTIKGIGVAGVLPAALVGANLRVADRVVVGIEGEVAPGVSTTDFKLDWLGAIRGRWGYLVTPANLVYATAGWVTTGVKTKTIGGAITIPGQHVNALQVGGGVESALTANWLVRFDYQYAMARHLDEITVDVDGLPTAVKATPRWHYGKVALVYLFGPN